MSTGEVESNINTNSPSPTNRRSNQPPFRIKLTPKSAKRPEISSHDDPTVSDIGILLTPPRPLIHLQTKTVRPLHQETDPYEFNERV